jgi:hypothetical protein
MHLDDVLPQWHHHKRHQIAIAAPPDAVLRAIDEVTWREVPVFRVLVTMRGLGKGARADSRVVDQFIDMGFTELVRADDEMVAGAICDFPRMGPALPLGTAPAEAFRAFQKPGHVKMVLNFRYADAVLTSETRVFATDVRSKRLFTLYWLAIRAGSGLIRHVWLRAIRRRAEAAVN